MIVAACSCRFYPGSVCVLDDVLKYSSAEFCFLDSTPNFRPEVVAAADHDEHGRELLQLAIDDIAPGCSNTYCSY